LRQAALPALDWVNRNFLNDNRIKFLGPMIHREQSDPCHIYLISQHSDMPCLHLIVSLRENGIRMRCYLSAIRSRKDTMSFMAGAPTGPRIAGHVLNSLCEMAECELTRREEAGPASPVSREPTNDVDERLRRIETLYNTLRDRCQQIARLNEEIGGRIGRFQDRRDDLELRRARLPKVAGLAASDGLRAEAKELLRDVERDLARLGDKSSE
jgi:hypothetical protein